METVKAKSEIYKKKARKITKTKSEPQVTVMEAMKPKSERVDYHNPNSLRWRTITDIAKRFLDLDTIETRHCSDDFQEQAIWQIRKALEAAYNAGQTGAAFVGKNTDDIEPLWWCAYK